MSLLTLIVEAIEPDMDRLERIDGLPVLRVSYLGAESVVIVLPVTDGMAKLLDVNDALADARERLAAMGRGS